MFLAKTCEIHDRFVSGEEGGEIQQDMRGWNHLSELDTHLVVRVDSPDGSLDVNLML